MNGHEQHEYEELRRRAFDDDNHDYRARRKTYQSLMMLTRDMKQKYRDVH